MPTEEAKKGIVNRLRTIKGHIEGIERMIDEGKPCDDVLLQIAAVKSSIHKVGLVIMEDHAMECLMTDENGNVINKDEMENVIKTLVKYSK